MQTSRWKRLVVAVLLSGVILSMGVSHALALQVGEKAPDFTLPGTTAEEINSPTTWEKSRWWCSSTSALLPEVEPRKRWPFNLTYPSLRPPMPRSWA